MLNQRNRILVVDDDRAIASTLATIFESEGYETATANSGEEAVKVASSFQPDCIVSDVMMGAMNGIEAAIEILGVLPQCEVLFISGNAPCLNLLEQAIAKGFEFEILAKPVPVLELLARIAEILSESASQSDSNCSHLHCAFPTTAKRPGSISFEGKPSTTTYVVCLDCGKEFPCDSLQMATNTA